jgi:hypothetical protein
MLKKVTVICLVLIYSAFSVGIAKSTHFCMGREQGSSLFSWESKKCPCFRLTSSTNSCCADEHELIKIENDQSAVQILLVHIPSIHFILDLSPTDLDSVIQCAFSTMVEKQNQPPPKVPIYQVNCSLVFYDEIS